MDLDSTREELQVAYDDLVGVLEQANMIANWQMEYGKDQPTELDWKLLSALDQIAKALDLYRDHIVSLYEKLGAIK